MDTNAVEKPNSVAIKTEKPSVTVDPPSKAAPETQPSARRDSVTVSRVGRLFLEEAKEKVKTDTANQDIEAVQTDNSNRASFQRKITLSENNQVVTKLIDPKTKDVVRQIPAEEQLRLQEAIRNASENFTSQDVTE